MPDSGPSADPSAEADGDGKLAFDGLKAAEPVLTDYLNQHVKLEVNPKTFRVGLEGAL